MQSSTADHLTERTLKLKISRRWLRNSSATVSTVNPRRERAREADHLTPLLTTALLERESNQTARCRGNAQSLPN